MGSAIVFTGVMIHMQLQYFARWHTVRKFKTKLNNCSSISSGKRKAVLLSLTAAAISTFVNGKTVAGIFDNASLGAMHRRLSAGRINRACPLWLSTQRAQLP